MATVDWVMLALLAWGAWTGFKKGLLVEVVSTVALVIAVIAGFRFLDQMSIWLKPHLPDAGKALPVISFLLLFFGIIFGLSYLAKVTRKVLNYTIFGTFDKIGGAFLGATKVLVSISAVLWFAGFIGLRLPASFSEKSLLVPVAKQAGGLGYRLLAGLLPLRNNPGQALSDWFQETTEPSKP